MHNTAYHTFFVSRSLEEHLKTFSSVLWCTKKSCCQYYGVLKKLLSVLWCTKKSCKCSSTVVDRWAGFGSLKGRGYGSEDPDHYKKLTDPEHDLK
jgi:hypothetical protein